MTRFNDDRQVTLPVPFLKERTVLYADSWIGTSHSYIEDNWDDILFRLDKVGYTFVFLPDLVSQLTPGLLEYMFPGQKDIIFPEDMYQRVQDLAELNDKTGFLYKRGGYTYFRTIPESPWEDVEAAIDDFIYYLSEPWESSTCDVRFSKRGVGPLLEEFEVPRRGYKASRKSLDLETSAAFKEIEESLDPRARAIIEAWEKIEREFGVTIEDLALMLGYKVKLSHLVITTSGKILLPGFGDKEVKMDDLTKAVYFFYLRHPEGARLKELQDHEEEILGYYMGITGRDDVGAIRNSVHNLLDPYGNSLNVCMSRVKKAFRDIVGDRIAKYYYIDGHYAGIRKVAIDRDHVIREH